MKAAWELPVLFALAGVCFLIAWATPGSVEMSDVGAGLAMMIVFEGLLLALFANRMSRIAEDLRELQPIHVRGAGLFAAMLGVVVVWLIRS